MEAVWYWWWWGEEGARAGKFQRLAVDTPLGMPAELEALIDAVLVPNCPVSIADVVDAVSAQREPGVNAGQKEG